MKILVTGANGFIGSRLVRRFLERGDEVRALVRPTSNLALLEGLDPEYVHGDVTDAPGLRPAVEGVDAVVHTAAALGETSQESFDRVNVGGTANLCDAILQSAPGLGRFVLISSIAASGPGRRGVARLESDAPAPVSMYGRSKLRGEEAAAVLRGRVPLTIVRPPIVYGGDGDAMLPLVQGVQRRVIADFTGGPRPVSFVDFRDLVEGIILATTHEQGGDETFFLVGPEDGTLADFQREIARALGVRAVRLALPGGLALGVGHLYDQVKRLGLAGGSFGSDKIREGLGDSWVVSSDRARERLGYAPRIGWSEGIRDMLDGYRTKGWL